ncbi:MAG: Zn-dependent exopeptidase M28 [Ruminococcaceae bacterium]|nr:Zn-dependent exopeptidase M28 [Oscillospiraceae bacterium]
MNSEKISDEIGKYSSYVIEKITEVCEKCGPRAVCSEGDKKARKYFVRDAEEVCDETTVEEFRCSDKAFMSWVSVGATLMITAIVLFVFGMPVISLALTLLTLFFIVSEFFFYKQTLDVFFRKKDTANVIGKIKSSGETKRRIILCGHTDSAFEWTYTYHGGRPAVATVIVSAVVTIVAAIAGSVTAIVSTGIFNPSVIFSNGNKAVTVFGIVLLCLIPFMIAALFFCNFKKPVTGANDNLTGCYISLAVAKYLKDNNIRLENTEIVIALVNGEESGLRGSKDFAKRHKEEFTDKNVETIFVAIDTIHDFDFMKIILGDMNGTVKNDKRVANLIKESGKKAGYDKIDIGTIDLGSTDAAAFSQIGVPAASFIAMDPTPARYYHTRLDTADILDEKTIRAGLEIAMETVLQFDKNGLK